MLLHLGAAQVEAHSAAYGLRSRFAAASNAGHKAMCRQLAAADAAAVTVQVAHHAVQQHGESAVAWAMLAMLYTQQGAQDSSLEGAATNADFKAQELAAADLEASESLRAGNAYLQLEILLLDLHFGDIVQEVRGRVLHEYNRCHMQSRSGHAAQSPVIIPLEYV